MKQPSTSVIRSLMVAGLSICLGLLMSSASDPQITESGLSSAPLTGQSLTLLPDGRWLAIGGQGSGGSVASATIWDSKTGVSVPVSGQLEHPRAWHTATLIPDGAVLIFGGVGTDGKVVKVGELFNPQTQNFDLLSSNNLTPRANHTATLLTDGRVLIVGGISGQDKALATAELWDPASQTVQALPAGLSLARQSHRATLLPDGTVLLWGGIGKDGQALNNGEIYDPVSQQFTLVHSFIPPTDSGVPDLTGSIPVDGATDMPLDNLIAVRLSKPLRMETVNVETVTLTGPGGTVPAKVVPAEGGMLAFITPKTLLAPGVVYTVRLSGPTDQGGIALPETAFSFSTVGDQSEEDWIPDANNLRGDWRTKRPDSPWRSLAPLLAEPGVTAVSGQVLKLDGQPLANVTLEIEGKTARTDDTGRFLLRSPPSGQRVLVIDGRTANGPGKTYGVFEVAEIITEGQTNVLPYTIWMPKIDTAHAVRIPSPTTSEVIVTTPRIPGLEVHIPPQTVIRDRNGRAVTSVSITPVPVDRPPFPLPPGVQVPIYFTIQPGGADIETLSETIAHGARIIYPNYVNQPAGTRVDFWNYEPSGAGWYIYGQGTVTVNGRQIIPDLGVAIYKFTGAMVGFPINAPADGPPAGGIGDGEPVDLFTGLLVVEKTDLLLPDVLPIALTRTYRPRDTVSRPFGIGTTHPYELFLTGNANPYTVLELILPDGGRIHYDRISAGTGYGDAVYEHISTPTKFYKSQIKYTVNGWYLTLKDGTVYVFETGINDSYLQSIQDRYGNKITITRPDLENITRITSPNGKWIEFTVDSGSRITQAKDNSGRVVAYTYDTGGRLTTVTDPNGGITQYTYDSNSQMLTIQDARGIVYLSNVYDANGRVIQQTQADGTTYQFAYTLDGNGKVIQTDVTDPRGNVRRVTFNSSGYMLTDTHAVGRPEQQTATYTRDSVSNFIASAADSLNRTTTYAYDSMGNVTSLTRLSGTPDSVTTSYTYEPAFNQVASTTDPLNHTTTFGRDAQGNLTAVTDPLGHQTTLTYNALGQPVSVADPLNNTTQFTYDMGDLTAVTDPLGNSTTRIMDSVGRLRSVTNPLGFLTIYDYDPLNQLTKVTDPLAGMTSFSYDTNGNLLSVTDARNNPTIYTYDNMNQMATRKDPLLVVESYPLYDGKGNLKTFNDRKGQTTQFIYDALNRRTKATYADSSTTDYIYDGGDRLHQIIDSISGTITLDYDNLDRLTQETTPQGSVSYTYDAAGRRTSMTVAGQPIVNYAYDNANRLTDITQGSSNVHFDYDAAGRRTKTTLPNGVTENYTYDVASRLTGIEYWNGTTLLGNLTYTYDAAGNRTKIGGSYARTGLPQAVSSASYNAANQQTNWAGTTLSYDANGNLIGDGANTYTWDARDRLASMTGASFSYDALGRRTSKTIGGASTGYLYDGQNPVQELLGGSPTANILMGLRIDEYLTRTDAAGTRAFLTDVQGSTVALTDTTGTVQTEYTFDPFGNTSVTGTSSSNSFQYTGRENDGTGLYYYRARYYSSIFQRFISNDPIGFDGGDYNLYAYVGNNPINGKDPTGLALYGNWCGPGGSGTPSNCIDRACAHHDMCYDACGLNYINRWVPNLFSKCAIRCDAALVKRVKKCGSGCSGGASGAFGGGASGSW
jgi:RHS repeat-associated protein